MPNLGTNAAHGVTDFASYVLENLSTQSALLRGGARFVPITGKSAKIPRVTNDGTAVWVAESAEIPSDAPEGELIELLPKKVANVVGLSNESIDDASVGELDIVGRALTRSVAVAADARAFSESAVSSTAPAGLLPSITVFGPEEISLDAIIAAVGMIEGAGGIATTVWINPVDLTALRLIKTGTGSNQPVLQPDMQERGAERVAGALLVSTPALPVGQAIVAEASQVLVGVRKDIEVKFSSDARFTSDQTVARVIARLDFKINDANGLVLLDATA